MYGDIYKNKEYQKVWSVSICKESEKGKRKNKEKKPSLQGKKKKEHTLVDEEGTEILKRE